MAIGQENIVSVVSDTEPVTLDEAKIYLNVTTDRFDAQITSQISAARAYVETYINRDVLPREREQFILEDITDNGIIDLYGTPINSTEDITVTIQGEEITENDGWEKIGLGYDQQIKITDPNQTEIKISYQTAGIVSDPVIKQGVLAILGEIYEKGQIENKWVWATLAPLKKPFV